MKHLSNYLVNGAWGNAIVALVRSSFIIFTTDNATEGGYSKYNAARKPTVVAIPSRDASVFRVNTPELDVRFQGPVTTGIINARDEFVWTLPL